MTVLQIVGYAVQYLCIALAVFIMSCLLYHKKYPDVSWEKFSTSEDSGYGDSTASDLTIVVLASIIWPISVVIYMIYLIVSYSWKGIKYIGENAFNSIQSDLDQECAWFEKYSNRYPQRNYQSIADIRQLINMISRSFSDISIYYAHSNSDTPSTDRLNRCVAFEFNDGHVISYTCIQGKICVSPLERNLNLKEYCKISVDSTTGDVKFEFENYTLVISKNLLIEIDSGNYTAFSDNKYTERDMGYKFFLRLAKRCSKPLRTTIPMEKNIDQTVIDTYR